MEGILLDPAVAGSIVALLSGAAILAIAVAAILLGSMAEEEAKGRRLYWAEWPIPGSGTETPSKEEKISRAA